MRGIQHEGAFYDRDDETRRLTRFLAQERGGLVVVYGRRRCGKPRAAEHGKRETNRQVPCRPISRHRDAAPRAARVRRVRSAPARSLPGRAADAARTTHIPIGSEGSRRPGQPDGVAPAGVELLRLGGTTDAGGVLRHDSSGATDTAPAGDRANMGGGGTVGRGDSRMGRGRLHVAATRACAAWLGRHVERPSERHAESACGRGMALGDEAEDRALVRARA